MDVIDRKINLMAEAGIEFKVNQRWCYINAQQLRQEFDVVLLTGGSTVPRDLPVPGREPKASFCNGIPRSKQPPCQ